MDEHDFEPEHDVLDDPDLYALVFRHQVEATFTTAELADLLRGAQQLQRAERERLKRSPKKGLAAAVGRALGGPSSEVEVLALKLSAVMDRAAERQGYKPVREAIRRFMRRDDE